MKKLLLMIVIAVGLSAFGDAQAQDTTRRRQQNKDSMMKKKKPVNRRDSLDRPARRTDSMRRYDTMAPRRRDTL